jgi:hypothetical protein
MGRRKLPIKRIADEKKRQTTFAKRKIGLIKKAMELSILCDCDVAVLVSDRTGDLVQYASTDINKLWQRFMSASQPFKVLDNSNYQELCKKENEVNANHEKDSPPSTLPYALFPLRPLPSISGFPSLEELMARYEASAQQIAALIATSPSLSSSMSNVNPHSPSSSSTVLSSNTPITPVTTDATNSTSTSVSMLPHSRNPTTQTSVNVIKLTGAASSTSLPLSESSITSAESLPTVESNAEKEKTRSKYKNSKRKFSEVSQTHTDDKTPTENPIVSDAPNVAQNMTSEPLDSKTVTQDNSERSAKRKQLKISIPTASTPPLIVPSLTANNSEQQKSPSLVSSSAVATSVNSSPNQTHFSAPPMTPLLNTPFTTDFPPLFSPHFFAFHSPHLPSPLMTPTLQPFYPFLPPTPKGDREKPL